MPVAITIATNKVTTNFRFMLLLLKISKLFLAPEFNTSRTRVDMQHRSSAIQTAFGIRLAWTVCVGGAGNLDFRKIANDAVAVRQLHCGPDGHTEVVRHIYDDVSHRGLQ